MKITITEKELEKIILERLDVEQLGFKVVSYSFTVGPMSNYNSPGVEFEVFCE
jgi:hypothetical protein